MNLYNDRFSYMKGEMEIGSILDFWTFHCSNEWTLLSEISEFLVAKALNVEKPTNKEFWDVYDIRYHGIRVEVKETSYCHSWEFEPKKPSRVFSIEKSYGYQKREPEYYKRYNDVYVFCLNTITDREKASPLNADTWEFYVVRTSVIDELFGNQKKVSLGRIQRLVKAGKATKCDYQGIQSAIDSSFNEAELYAFAKKGFIIKAKQAVKDAQEEWNDDYDEMISVFFKYCKTSRLLNLIDVVFYVDCQSVALEYQDQRPGCKGNYVDIEISYGFYNMHLPNIKSKLGFTIFDNTYDEVAEDFVTCVEKYLKQTEQE